jgi:4-hydroxy-tetrahydrodipicolinate synthase
LKEIKGIIPAMVTPFDRSSGDLNEAALRKLTNHLIDGGVHGLFVVGSQGEFWAMTAEEKKRAFEIVMDETNGRVPVYGGTAGITTRETIALTKLAESAGMDAVSVLSPFFLAPTEGELYEHYREVAASTKLPVLLYGNPARTGVMLSPGLVSRLAEIDNIVGIKDSSAQLELTMQYILGTPDDFAVIMGRDSMIFAAFMAGAKGAIAATGNVVPNLVVQIYENFIKGDLDAAKKAQMELFPLRAAFTWGTFPVVIKEALDMMGIEAGPARMPVGPMSEERRKELKALLKKMGVI